MLLFKHVFMSVVLVEEESEEEYEGEVTLENKCIKHVSNN